MSRIDRVSPCGQLQQGCRQLAALERDPISLTPGEIDGKLTPQGRLMSAFMVVVRSSDVRLAG
jgi:hypothetical protein